MAASVDSTEEMRCQNVPNSVQHVSNCQGSWQKNTNTILFS